MGVVSAAQQLAYRTIRAATSRPGADANCILILHHMLPLGGLVHATSLLQSLATTQPLPVVVATHGLGLQVFGRNPSLAGVIATPDPLTDFVHAGVALRKALKSRKLRPSSVITDLSNQRSLLALEAALFVQVPLVGFSLADALQRAPLKRDKSHSLIDNNLRIAATLGGSAEHREPTVYISAEEAAAARALLAQHNPDSWPVALLCTQPSGGQPSAWHADRFAAVTAALHARGLLPVFTGTAAQTAAIDRIRLMSNVPTVSIAGSTNIATLTAAIALADVCIAIDSGPMHIARATQTPLVVLAPTYQDPTEWLPLNVPTARVLRGSGTSPVPPTYKLDEIDVPQVISAINDLLAAHPPSTSAREARLNRIISATDHLAAQAEG